MATATETKEVTLLTDRPGFRAVIEGEDVIRNERGTVIAKQPGTVLQFRGATAVLREGKDGKATVNGEEQHWEFEPTLEAIKRHKLFDVRFWVEGEGPFDQRPNMAELREMIEYASPEDLRAIYETEREGHNRPQALSLLSDALMGADAKDDGGSTTEPG